MGSVGSGARDMFVHESRDSLGFRSEGGQDHFGAVLDPVVVHLIVACDKCIRQYYSLRFKKRSYTI